MSNRKQAVELVEELAAPAVHEVDLSLLNGSEEEAKEGAVDVGNGKAAKRWTALHDNRRLIGNTIVIDEAATHPLARKLHFQAHVNEHGVKLYVKTRTGLKLDLGLQGGPYQGGLSEAMDDAQDRIVVRANLLQLFSSTFEREEAPVPEDEVWENLAEA